ncbi:MAG: 16S rRNA (cytosine(1402)-N(4))-methyltransferase RsmH [Clostridia bacterium]|nr:16S rRNA (cytosine(1402)-N(4))-methyltransferase RsmH [Clostridia bacterium]
MSREFKHISVLLDESVELLEVKAQGTYVDGTLGGGGHASLVCSKLTDGATFVGIDRDMTAIEAASKRLAEFGDMVNIVHSNFAHVKRVLADLGIKGIDGAILDLGVSSPQLDTAERGFSYNMDARLDMRMNRDDRLSAYEVVNEYSEAELTKIIFEYGEDKFARQIARAIVVARAEKPIETTFQLSETIKSAIPAKIRFADKHPAKRTFQAIRIEVNNELGILEQAICDFVDVLNPGGVLSVITFHSLEDRIVKQAFAKLASGCECPKNFPVCVCGKKPVVKIVNKKPIVSNSGELEMNIRAHSAKLRAVKKI